MCGIAGICGFGRGGKTDILRMNDKMHHRGPDSGDYWLDDMDKVVLGHRRLSIVDLSENGAQPMVSCNQRYVICFNGEIYNHNELKKNMEKEGIRLKFRGTSDTEVILNAFVHYGVEGTLSKIKGMFAIALWDREDKTLYLMRDRVGEKPLYYGFVKNHFVFASDLACIEAIDGFRNPLNQEVMQLYFQYGYIPAPHSIYKNIWKLEAGCLLKIRKPFQKIEKNKYWSMEETAKRGQASLFSGSEEEASKHLEILLKGAIKGQMIADVPLGAFLSGGIDSALIVSLMQAQSAHRIKTFTIGFEEAKFNEAGYAKDIARHLGTEHTELYVGKKEAMQIIKDIPMAFSEPFADSSQIPTMLVSKMTREHVTVSLSGDGGDELFCGYNTYRVAEAELQALEKRFGYIPKGFRQMLGNRCRKITNPRFEAVYKIGNYFTMNSVEEAHRRMGMEDARIPLIAKNQIRLPHSNTTYQDNLLVGSANNLMLMDLLQYHVDDILVKVDRAGMFYSLESRIPLLDKDVVEFAWTLPLSYKYSEGITKRVMRDILYRYVPKEMMERPKKGFSIPLGMWLKDGDLRFWAEEILEKGRYYLKGVIDEKIVDSLWRDYIKSGRWNEQLWYILMMEQWLLDRKRYE